MIMVMREGKIKNKGGGVKKTNKQTMRTKMEITWERTNNNTGQSTDVPPLKDLAPKKRNGKWRWVPFLS